jgi:hypothetical protein
MLQGLGDELLTKRASAACDQNGFAVKVNHLLIKSPD